MAKIKEVYPPFEFKLWQSDSPGVQDKYLIDTGEDRIQVESKDWIQIMLLQHIADRLVDLTRTINAKPR